VIKGTITQREGWKLLQAYGLPMTPPSKVYTGLVKRTDNLW